ncbi:ferredoxin reductase [Hydrogenophaga sp.]|uniref:ferredoxin reductase n=1 Tax=Hydrogenophaga sp. TaxID=1904254 RepID=UPI0027312D6F|nr:ferredoxin reductase [Hydrogenophaga sp.]MDP2017330.1 ferredoxin reductase [Hydrogenophaga sp.]MDP3168580.1 ferredoxin reductase [Hydrogenophaga sp.]MDP3812557.1 ferredoxin reductase [Hydrogenophaga sp.]
MTLFFDRVPDWLDVVVARHWKMSADVVGIELVASGSAPLPGFAPGAYIDVLAPGRHLRPYSLCNSARERHRYVIAVLRDRQSKRGSAALHDQVRPGDLLRIRSPQNEFPLVLPAVFSVLLGAGIGVAPLMSMADTLWHRGSPFAFHIGFRSREQAPFLQELQRAPYRDQVNVSWSEKTGRIRFAPVLSSITPAADIYACGPAGFMNHAAAAFSAAGRSQALWHQESFVTLPVQSGHPL